MATLCQPAGRLDQSIINEKRMEHRGKFEIPSAFVSMSRNKSMGGSRERERERERETGREGGGGGGGGDGSRVFHGLWPI